jgi:hypothetical protein
LITDEKSGIDRPAILRLLLDMSGLYRPIKSILLARKTIYIIAVAHVRPGLGIDGWKNIFKCGKHTLVEICLAPKTEEGGGKTEDMEPAPECRPSLDRHRKRMIPANQEGIL